MARSKKRKTSKNSVRKKRKTSGNSSHKAPKISNNINISALDKINDVKKLSKIFGIRLFRDAKRIRTIKFDYMMIPKGTLIYRCSKPKDKLDENRPYYFSDLHNLLNSAFCDGKDDDILKVFTTTKNIRLLDILNKKNIKSLLEIIYKKTEIAQKTKNKKELARLDAVKYSLITMTGYEISSYNNAACGYIAKPTERLAKCSSSDNMPPYTPDCLKNGKRDKDNYRSLILAKWLCNVGFDGWIHGNVHRYPPLDYQINKLMDWYRNSHHWDAMTLPIMIDRKNRNYLPYSMQELVICNVSKNMKKIVDKDFIKKLVEKHKENEKELDKYFSISKY